jgi:ribose 5-phosphate isomerase B
MKFKTLIFGADHAGFSLKTPLKAYASELGAEVIDLGTHSHESVDYPDYAKKVVQKIKENTDNMGILLCGSGIGISIAANRFSDIRAALCRTGLEAELARRHNDANILCLGGRLTGIEMAKECLYRFVTIPFKGGHHQKRIDKLRSSSEI